MARRIRKQTLIGAGALLLFGLAYLLSGDIRHFISQSIGVLSKTDPRNIEGGIRELRSYLLGFGIWAPIISSFLMILQMIVAPIPGQLITFTNGLLFGAFWGTILSWSSAMVGAALCYGIAIAFGRPVVERLVGKKSLDYVDRFFERYGTRAILVARLIPFVPFDPISYGAGLTSMGFWRFFIATGIGQLPATIVYSWLGDKATGTIKIIFWVFVVVVALAVTVSVIKPRFDRRILKAAESIEKNATPWEKLPSLILIDKLFLHAFVGFLTGFDVSWLLMKNTWFDMRMRTGMLMPVFMAAGLIVGLLRMKGFALKPRPMGLLSKAASWLLLALNLTILATIVINPMMLQIVLPIQMREGFFMSDMKLETARIISYMFFALGIWRLGAWVIRFRKDTGKADVSCELTAAN